MTGANVSHSQPQQVKLHHGAAFKAGSKVKATPQQLGLPAPVAERFTVGTAWDPIVYLQYWLFLGLSGESGHNLRPQTEARTCSL